MLNIIKTKYLLFAPYKTSLPALDDLVIHDLSV